MGKKIDQKKEKAARNEAYAKRFRKRRGKRQKQTKEQLNHCRVPGHPATCQFNACPNYNRTQAPVAQSG